MVGDGYDFHRAGAPARFGGRGAAVGGGEGRKGDTANDGGSVYALVDGRARAGGRGELHDGSAPAVVEMATDGHGPRVDRNMITF